MTFLLDTNVLSEWVKPQPDPGVVRWLGELDEDRVFISVATLAELRHGAERLAQGSRRRRLEEWLGHDLPLRFEGRILPIDRSVGEAWGVLMAKADRSGHPAHAMDAFLAATAKTHGLTLVTRNTSDFVWLLDMVLNPWSQT